MFRLSLANESVKIKAKALWLLGEMGLVYPLLVQDAVPVIASFLDSSEPLENQKEFVAENIQSLAEAYATRNEGNNALPLAVYNDDDLIGFIMIGKGTVGNPDESDLIKENYCFWRFMIDKKFQGQGLGKQTMDAVIALIRTFPFGEAQKVWLSYEPENTRAREIYQKYGFVENGEMCGNEIVAVYELL